MFHSFSCSQARSKIIIIIIINIITIKGVVIPTFYEFFALAFAGGFFLGGGLFVFFGMW